MIVIPFQDLQKRRILTTIYACNWNAGGPVRKTTVVREITKILADSEVVVIPQDSYYKDNSHLLLKSGWN